MPANDTCRIGVYICHCGLNIASKVDVQALEQYAATLPKVAVAKTYKFMCSDPGQQLIKDDLAAHRLTHLVVASCSPLMHEPTFRAVLQDAGVNPYLYQMVNIREQVSWVTTDLDRATRKAKLLLTAAAGFVRPITCESLRMTRTAGIRRPGQLSQHVPHPVHLSAST